MESRATAICRCENLTEDELRKRIDEWQITSLNEFKLITRAGKGACQGRTCSHLMARLLADVTGKPVADLPPWTYRIPVRPVPMEALVRQDGASKDEAIMLTMMDVTDEDRHPGNKGA